ncbi:transporter [Lutibacter profundi]|uniref:Transporter n=1 Tax=Lutibacter profundi TaxID=1622118 RepID=A0A120IEE8_9FLAO|nr:TolC family protein [Lutibacter profundi]AMC11457.1 transporter [Lutibacter profundi]
MKKLSTFIILCITLNSFGQEKLSLNECYSLVNKNYPLAKQYEMFARQNTLDKEIIKTGKLPKLDFDAQATYQSDVIELPIAIPGVTIASPNKDQYKATISVNQLVYDGGLINASTKVKEVALKAQQKNIEVNLYQLKKEVNQLYFSIILLQEKRALLNAKKKQLVSKLKEVKAGIKFGVLLPTSDKVLEAELLKIEQQYTEIDQNKISLIKTLSSLIDEDISLNVSLENPTILPSVDTEIKRPELDLFQLQKEQINASEQLIAKKNAPKLMGFATGGYGNPGLNMLDNAFQTYYVVGLKLNWNIFDWSARKKEQKSLKITKEIINNQQEIFTLNTNIELDQQQTEIAKITTFIESDKTIIELRKKILKSAESQLKNGVITSSAYITELTNLYEAENNLSTHKIELLLAKTNYKTTKGN